jgi:RimJ/RimL family protein N-acetyltransferase
MSTPQWRSPHLDLRYLTRADLPTVAAMLESPEVCEHLFFGPNTEAQTRAYFEPLLDAMAPALARGERPPLHCFALLEPRTGALMGECALVPVDYADRVYMLGYQLDAPYWGRRFGTWAARFLVQFAFDALDARRLVADCFATNLGSASILRRVGFQHEGTLRAHYLKGGERHDNLLFGLLAEESDPDTRRTWRAAFTADAGRA